MKSKDHVVATYNNAFEYANGDNYPSLVLADHSKDLIICETDLSDCEEVEYPKDPMAPGTAIGILFGVVTGSLLAVYLIVAFIWPKWGWKWLLPRGKSKPTTYYSQPPKPAPKPTEPTPRPPSQTQVQPEYPSSTVNVNISQRNPHR